MSNLSEILVGVQNAPILVVEDNPDDRLLILRSFKKNHVLNEIVVVSDGTEALDYLFARGKYSDPGQSKMPALILLDLGLPGMTGFEVLSEIRNNEATKFVPVVVLTSSAEDRDILESYELQANSYVQKPVDFEDLVDAMGKISVYWLLVNKPASSIS